MTADAIYCQPVGTVELTRVLENQKLASGDEQDEKIFLSVDDDPATLEMYVRIAQSWLGKHKVLKARNGREALDLMQQQCPGLVLFDLMMPELDGFGVLEAMKEKESTRDIPVIVLTGKILTENDKEEESSYFESSARLFAPASTSSCIILRIFSGSSNKGLWAEFSNV